MSLATAVVTATLFAVFAPPYVNYQCWFSWSRFGTALGSLVYLLLAGGGGGFVGWLAAQGMKAQPTESLAVNGFFYGVVGALLVRANFRVAGRPRDGSAPVVDGDLRAAASLLGASLVWTTSLLDSLAARRAERWLGELDDGWLLKEALRINARILELDIDDEAKKVLQSRLVPAMTLVRSAEPDRRAEGRALVEQFCTTFIVKHHLAKPV